MGTFEIQRIKPLDVECRRFPGSAADSQYRPTHSLKSLIQSARRRQELNQKDYR